MPNGIVRNYSVDKGYGVIIANDGKSEIFVHHSKIVGAGFRYLLPKEPVNYEIEWDEQRNRIQAINVRPPMDRVCGTVSSFNYAKGFGFIKPDDGGPDLFFHHSEILTSGSARATAEAGERVQFTIGAGDKGSQALLVKREDSRSPLLRFAEMGDEEEWLSKLASLAEPEEWNFRVSPSSRSNYPVLRSYILHTFARLEQEDVGEPGKKIAVGKVGHKPYACFNTGLVTPNQEEIFALFSRKDRGADGREWRLARFCVQSDHHMIGTFERYPDLANYFDDPSVLLYDRRCELYMDRDHIVDGNISRFPPGLCENKNIARNTLVAAQAETQKRVFRNYKTAVPQFHHGSVQLLLPLCLLEKGKADLALVVSRKSSADRQYRGETVLTLDMAYNNARLLCRPDSDWLRPKQEEDPA